MALAPAQAGSANVFCLDLHEEPADRSHMAIKFGRLGSFQIGEEATDPGGEMLSRKNRRCIRRRSRNWPPASPAMISQRMAA